jgi:hypothetical protein
MANSVPGEGGGGGQLPLKWPTLGIYENIIALDKRQFKEIRDKRQFLNDLKLVNFVRKTNTSLKVRNK